MHQTKTAGRAQAFDRSALALTRNFVGNRPGKTTTLPQ
jgi:hypothetical protein